MFSLCPKCETGKLDSTGTCNLCGYNLKVFCSNCSMANIPSAKFCGNCGKPMSLASEASRFFNFHIDYILRLKLRKFLAGASFGALLTLFTFGSMGMHSHNNIAPSSAVMVQNVKQHVSCSKLRQTINKEVSEWLNIDKKNQLATLSHLVNTTNIILKHLAPVARLIDNKAPMAESADEYLNLLNNFSKSDKLTRGSAAIIVFNLLSDFMGFTNRDFQDNGYFSDIPTNHCLSIPATALKQLGIFAEYENREFKPAKIMTLPELNKMTKAIVATAEIYIQEKFVTSPPLTP